MKKIISIAFFFGMTSTALAAPIHCESLQNESNYTVSISSDWKSGYVNLNDEYLAFGSLICSDNIEGVLLKCFPKDVADAGYSALLYYNKENKLALTLNEISFFGSKLVATLICNSAQ